MSSRIVLQSLLVMVYLSLAAQLHAQNEFPVPEIEGLELVRGETKETASKRAPIVFQFEDGRICAYGGNDHSYYSSDNGETWEKGPLGPLGKMAADLGDGVILNIYSTMVPQPDGKLKVTYQKSTDNWETFTEEYGTADIPLSTSQGTDNKSPRIPGLLMHHGLIKLPNGDLLASCYGNYLGDNIPIDAYPVELGCMKTRTVVVRSSDGGKTWVDPITVAYDTMAGVLNEPDVTGSQATIVPAVTQEGFNEADLVIAPNGDIICAMRSGGSLGWGVAEIYPTPMYVSRSSDQGKTWTVPTGMADRGCNPSLITLENDIIVCAYARPGVWVCFSDDNGKSWKGHTQVDVGNHYCYIAETGSDSFMVFRDQMRNQEGPILATRFTVRKK
jgi:hypothetical protein